MDSQDQYTYNALRCVSKEEQDIIKAIFTSHKKRCATTKHENLLIVGKSAHIFSHHSPLSYNLNKQGGQNGY